MFGHDDKHNQHDNDQVQVTPDAALDDIAADTPSADDNQAGAPSVSDDSAVSDVSSASTSSDSGDDNTPNADDNLLDIKRQALQQLSPLVDHLDQTPEEKFKTTMMMIQAADNQSLIKTAYDAAQAITDEKTRAQALLDVINEINYFTHPQDQDKKAA